MEYYIQSELNIIKSEINNLIIIKFEAELKKFKIDTKFNNNLNKYLLLTMVQNIISTYVPVTSSTDGIINNITELDFQQLITEIYVNFPNLKYPK